MEPEETEWERREREEREKACQHSVNHKVEHVPPADPRTPEELDAEARYNRECHRAQMILALAGELLVASVKTHMDKTSHMEPVRALEAAVQLHQAGQEVLDKVCDQALQRLIVERRKRQKGTPPVSR